MEKLLIHSPQLKGRQARPVGLSKHHFEYANNNSACKLAHTFYYSIRDYTEIYEN